MHSQLWCIPRNEAFHSKYGIAPPTVSYLNIFTTQHEATSLIQGERASARSGVYQQLLPCCGLPHQLVSLLQCPQSLSLSLETLIRDLWYIITVILSFGGLAWPIFSYVVFTKWCCCQGASISGKCWGKFKEICARKVCGYESLEGDHSDHNVESTVWPEILAGIYFGGLLKFLYLAEFTLAFWQKACAIMIFIAKWLTQTNSARLLKRLWGVHALLFDHNWVIFAPILSFSHECCNVQRLLSLLLANLLTLACSLWPRIKLYRSNAETENRLSKSAAVSYRQWSQRQSSLRPHMWRRSDCLRLPRTLLPPPVCKTL